MRIRTRDYNQALDEVESGDEVWVLLATPGGLSEKFLHDIAKNPSFVTNVGTEVSLVRVTEGSQNTGLSTIRVPKLLRFKNQEIMESFTGIRAISDVLRDL